MLGLLGIRLHPALRALIGAVLLVLGISAHRVGLTVVGVVFLGWAGLGLLGVNRARPDDEPRGRRYR